MKKRFKAFIRVVKSLKEDDYYSFGQTNVVEERLIEAEDKPQVKQILADKYPQFFPNGKVYERESKKDKAQFFYVVIFPLYNFESKMIDDGEWVCSSCNQKHPNQYISPPRRNERMFGDGVLFCKSEDDTCHNSYLKEKYQAKHGDLPDDLNYVTNGSPNYIYKITEKSTGKSYVGKTKNAPFFRWWNHLTHSSSPFGLHLRNTKLSDWTFEVLEELPSQLSNSDVLKIESKYMIEYDCLKNGFNSVVSNKDVVKPAEMPSLFNEE